MPPGFPIALDGDLKRTVQFLVERNVGVVIRDEQDLNFIGIREENAKANPKGKEQASSSGKGKASAVTVSQLASNTDVISKATLAQRARRQRERSARRQLAQQLSQRTRRERERAGECSQPRQPRFFPSLKLTRRRRRACLEWARMKALKANAIQSTSISMKTTESVPQRIMVTNAPGSSCMTAILPETPNLVDYPIDGRSTRLMNTMLSHPEPPDQVDLNSIPPPRKLGLELDRRKVQLDLHFKAIEGASSRTPCNLSSSNKLDNQHLINPGERYEQELGRGRFPDNMGNADCPQLKHCTLRPEISAKQTQIRGKYIHFAPLASTNFEAPVMTFSCGGPSVPESLGKPGVLHAARSECLKVMPEVTHSIDSKRTDDNQRSERFFCLPTFLKQRDESNQMDYIQLLLHLPPAELSRRAVELEKRAVQLKVEEGKEMQRVKDLNILGKSGLPS